MPSRGGRHSRMSPDEDLETLREAAAWFIRLRSDDVTDTDVAEWLKWCAANAKHLAAFESIELLHRQLLEINGAERESIVSLAADCGSPVKNSSRRRREAG